MRISIAMCTWNGASCLRAQLDSISRQTRKPNELVVCDDVSSDNTRSILQSFAASADFPVHIEENPTRLGSTANFSKAISLCQGDIIVLSDQDDVWEKEKLSIFERHFESDLSLGGLFTDAELIDQQGNKLHDHLWRKAGFGSSEKNALRRGHGLDVLINGNFITGATLAFRSCWKDLILPIPTGGVHDHWIALILLAASRLDFEPKPLIQYRCHPAQQLGIKKSNWCNISEIVHHLTEIDNSDYIQAAQRCDEIARRLGEFDAMNLSDAVKRCNTIAPHFRARGTLPKDRFKRIPGIIKETLNGNYFRYSFGIKSIFRDLLSDFRHGRYP